MAPMDVHTYGKYESDSCTDSQTDNWRMQVGTGSLSKNSSASFKSKFQLFG